MNRKTELWTCGMCGSDSVSQAVWINPNKPLSHPHSGDDEYQVEGDYGVDTDGYCNVCEKEVPLNHEEIDEISACDP